MITITDSNDPQRTVQIEPGWFSISKAELTTAVDAAASSASAAGVSATAASTDADRAEAAADEVAKEPYFLVNAGISDDASTNSNAAGGDLTVDADILLWDAGAWVVYDPASGVGPPVAGRNMIAFQAAKELRRRGYPKVYVVNDAYGGQPISQWVGSGTSSTYYVTLKSKVEAALASSALTTLGKTAIDGFGFGQGGPDSTTPIATYTANIETLKAQLRAETWGGAQLPMAFREIGVQTGFRGMDGYYRGPALYNDPYVYVVPTADLARTPDVDHLTGTAMNEAGRRVAAALLAIRPKPLTTNPNEIRGAVTMELEPVFEKGWHFNFDSGSNQVRFSPYTFTAGVSSTNFIGYDLDNGRWRWEATQAVDLVGQYVLAGTFWTNNMVRLNPIGGMRLGEYVAANFTDITHAVNTTGKFRGMEYLAVDTGQTFIAKGSAANAGWWIKDATSSSATPS
ncbi:MAG: sialate O-acetylesterase [Paracoccaceae bacterium]